MDNYTVRTDLAVESKEFVDKDDCKREGIQFQEYSAAGGEISVSKVIVESKNIAKRMGKPMGTYVTMEAPTMAEEDEGYHREISECLADELLKLLPKAGKVRDILVVGLGNRQVTADALGPYVVDQLLITRHMVKIYGSSAYGETKQKVISSIEPGVMAKTGMESVEIIRGIAEQTKPQVVIVVDALAARSVKRLNRTIQLSNTGIWPGSGVGNHRCALTEETLGIPVIAIGVPTVVDATTILTDLFREMAQEDPELKYLNLNRYFCGIPTELRNMYLTGKDIDALIRRVSYTISEGINIALATK